MIRFYAPDITETLTLPETESGHAVRVLRHVPGDEIEVVDGKGGLHICRIVADHPKHVAVEILRSELLPKVWKPELTLAVAPTKNMDRMEWLTEKVVELGIDRIVPLVCERSERRNLRSDRLEKIAVSAMKQSLKAVLPRIDEPTPLTRFLNETASSPALKFVAWCDSESERTLLAKAYKPDSDAILLIGPEGDFSPAEVKAALEAGYIPVSLGDNRLRTETAALSGIDTFHILNQHFSS